MLDYRYIDKYNTIEYNDFLYCLEPLSIGWVLIPIIGQDACKYLHKNNHWTECKVRCVVENNQLKVLYAGFERLSNELLEELKSRMTCTFKVMPYDVAKDIIESSIPQGDLWDVEIDEKFLDIQLDRFLYAKQCFIDEMECGYRTHFAISTFSFENNMLNLKDSLIQRNEELYSVEYTWNNGEDVDTRTGAYKSAYGGKMFFCDAEGGLSQHTEVYEYGSYYYLTGQIKKCWIKSVKKRRIPILRTELMEQSVNEPEKYSVRECDIPGIMAYRGDSELLEEIFDYIQFKKYLDYNETLLKYALMMLMNNDSRVDPEKTVAVLNLFIRKKMRCKNAGDLLEQVVENIALEESVRNDIIRCLEKLS